MYCALRAEFLKRYLKRYNELCCRSRKGDNETHVVILSQVHTKRLYRVKRPLKTQRKNSSPQFTQPNAKHTRKQVGICEEQLLFWFLLFSLRCNVIYSNKWQYTSVKENQCFKIINYNCLYFHSRQAMERFIVALTMGEILWYYDSGGYFRNFWVGICCKDPGKLTLYQS